MSGDREFYDNLDVRANYLAERDRADKPKDTLLSLSREARLEYLLKLEPASFPTL